MTMKTSQSARGQLEARRQIAVMQRNAVSMRTTRQKRVAVAMQRNNTFNVARQAATMRGMLGSNEEMSNPLGFIRNLTDASMCHLVYPEGKITIAFPIGHAYEMIADGDLPFKEFTEVELKEIEP
jgi:hypothetical protein